MIAINGKIVDFTNKDDKYQFADVVKDFKKTLSELREKHGTHVLIQTPSFKPKIDPVTKMQRPHKPFSWPYKTTVVTDDGTQDWVYSKSAPKIENGVAIPNENSFIIPRGDITISLDDEPDKVYFLMHTRPFKRGKMWIFDPTESEDKRALEIKMETRLKDVIYGEYSPLATDVNKLISIAKKWGVADAANLPTNGVRNALHDIVMQGEANKKKHKAGARGIDSFMEDIGGGEAVRIGALVQTAKDQGVLSLNRQTTQWQLIVAKGQTPVILMTAGNVGGDEAQSNLIDYLRKNKDDAELLEKVVNGDVKVEHGRVKDKAPDEEIIFPDDVDLSNIDQTDSKGKPVVTHPMLQKAAKGLGLNSFGLKSDELRDAVREKLEQLAQTT